MGVDVMRWLYLRQKPEQDLLFGYHRADEVRRQFLIPLWNVYSFLVTYANIDGWEPPSELVRSGLRAEAFQGSALDRWILARLHQVIARVTDRLEEYDAYGATMAVEPFLDDLTNWYVRRSRRRFWAKAGLSEASDADKHAAYTTLYHVLTTLTRLLAPFVPFVTEVIYQNLVRSVDPEAPESVHHTRWPEADAAWVDQALLDRMALVRQVVTLGHSARAGAGIKVRQPLARAVVHGADALREDGEMLRLIADELNVKEVTFVAQERDLVTYRLLPDNRKLGPKFGPRFPQVRAALAATDPSEAVRTLRAGNPLRLSLEGETVELAPDEVLIQTRPRSGMAVAAERGVTVAVETTLTPELEAEGLAREVVRRVQTLRKEAGLNLDDRIVTLYQADDRLAAVIARWRDYIQGETLSVELVGDALPAELPAEGAAQGEYTVNGHRLVLAIRKA